MKHHESSPSRSWINELDLELTYLRNPWSRLDPSLRSDRGKGISEEGRPMFANRAQLLLHLPQAAWFHHSWGPRREPSSPFRGIYWYGVRRSYRAWSPTCHKQSVWPSCRQALAIPITLSCCCWLHWSSQDPPPAGDWSPTGWSNRPLQNARWVFSPDRILMGTDFL